MSDCARNERESEEERSAGTSVRRRARHKGAEVTVTGEAVVLDVPCARFPSRLVAIIIDMTAQILLVVALLLILGASGAHLNAASLAAVALSLLILVFVGYPTIFETLSRG